MKYIEILTHPSGDVLVRDEHGHERWFKANTFTRGKDGIIIPKQKPVLTQDK